MPIDLKATYGDDYRIELDESYFAESGSSTKRCSNPWYFQIPGRLGHVAPYSGSRMIASLDPQKSNYRVKRLLELPGVEPFQVGDCEASVLFGLADFRAVAKFLGLRKRRKMSEEQRVAASDRLKSLRAAKNDAVGS